MFIYIRCNFKDEIIRLDIGIDWNVFILRRDGNSCRDGTDWSMNQHYGSKVLEKIFYKDIEYYCWYKPSSLKGILVAEKPDAGPNIGPSAW